MTLTMRAPRSRGMVTGFLLVLLGLWGGLVPFVGPYWHFAYTPDSTWTWTTGRLWLQVLPAIATVLGGLILLTASHRAMAVFGAWLAALAGAWFVVGGPLSTLWTSSGANQAGSPVGGATRQVLEGLAFFSALGVVITFLAGVALGRFLVVGVRDAALAAAPPAEAVPPTGRVRPGETAPPPGTVRPAAAGPVSEDPETVSGERAAHGWERTERPESAEPIPRSEQPWRGRYARPATESTGSTGSAEPAAGDEWVAGTPRRDQNR